MARRRRLALWAAAVLLLLLAVRLALTPLAAWRTRRILDSLRGYQAGFSGVSVSLFRLSYSIDGLTLKPTAKIARASQVRPTFRARHIEIALDLRAMARRRAIVAAVEVDQPKLEVIIAPSGSSSLGDPRLREKIFRLSPLAIERVQIKRAEMAFADLGRESPPAIRLHDLDVALENLATRPTLAGGEPALLAVSGTLQKTGQVSIFVTADPFARRVTFSGRGSVKGLELREVGRFLADEADLSPRGGTIDLIAVFHVRDGRMSAGVKPVLKDVEVEAVKPGVVPKLKEWLIEKGQRPERRPDARRSAAGFVPIRGDVVKPDADTWPAVLQLLRNAFTTGLGAGLDDLSKRQGAPQAREPPRTQRRR